MLYKKNKDEKLELELFHNPTSEYRGTPFWAWNCKPDREQMLRQIEYFKEMGFGGFHMHSRIVAAEKKLGFGSIVRQGLPFYGGNLTYLLPVELPKDCNLEVHIGKYKGVHCTVALDGGEEKPVSFAPSIATFHKVCRGAHTLRITLYGHRFNTFGCVHNCDEQYSYFGPDAWRTVGDRWSYEYQLKELGLLISPQIRFYE